MKALDIAFKDMLRSSRNLSVWIFGLVVPLLMSGIFYFAFGGLGDEGGFNLAVTNVVVVNQDQPAAQAGGFSAGQILADFVRSDGLKSILAVTEMSDATSARAAVDRQEAGVAVIIPAGLTAAMTNPGERAVVELYQDPTLTLGPGIVKGVVSQFVDGLAGSKVAAEVAYAQLAGHGLAADAATAQAIALEYGQWAQALGSSQQGATNALTEVRRPAETESTDVVTNVVSMIMAGMLVFYAFFTGAASAQNIVQEEQDGTLARLFTTPTPTSAILSGRMIATFVTLILQVTVLLAASALLFKVNWGQPVPMVLVATSMIFLSASFGLFLASLLKDTRQSGVVYGGVLTMMGMVGMIGIFTAQVPGSTGGVFEAVSLLVPQGWAVRGWQLIQAGGGVGDVLVTLLVMVGLAAIFFAVGLLRFRKRFA